jgi:hypothetical protein
MAMFAVGPWAGRFRSSLARASGREFDGTGEAASPSLKRGMGYANRDSFHDSGDDEEVFNADGQAAGKRNSARAASPVDDPGIARSGNLERDRPDVTNASGRQSDLSRVLKTRRRVRGVVRTSVLSRAGSAAQ